MFTLYFLPLWILSTIGLFVLVDQEVKSQESKQSQNALRQVRMIKNLTELEIRSMVSDVLVLALNPELDRQLASRHADGRRPLAESFLAYCQNRRNFQRLSLVDAQGREIVRVRNRLGAAAIVNSPHSPEVLDDPDLDLLGRLAPNEILVRSEDAPPPADATAPATSWLIKIAVPLHNSEGQKIGALLADHSGPELVENVNEEMRDHPGGFLLIDWRGNCLHSGPNDRPEAGDASKPAAGLSERRPAVWQQLARHDAGVARSPEAHYFFQTVRPSLVGLKQSTGASRAILSSATARAFSNKHWWKVVVHRPDPGWVGKLEGPLWRLLPPYAAAVLAMGLGCWALAAVAARQRESIRVQRLAQERMRMRSAFEYAALGMAIISPEGLFLVVNQHLCDLLGRTREQLIGEETQLFVDPEDRSLLLAALSAILTQDMTSTSLEMRLQTAGGRLVFSRISLALFKEAPNHPLHFIAHIQDLSDSKRLQAEKESMEAELRQAQKLEAIGTLASGIAHDMNNILGIMNANAELTLQELADDLATPQAQRLQRILRAGNRGRELVENILNFCQLSDTERQSLELAREVDEVVKLLDASLPKNVTFRKNFNTPSPRVLASFSDLQQIMANLCLNASQAMAPRGGTITIKVGEVWPEQMEKWGCRPAPPGRWAVMRVTDTGHGMDAKTRQRIFDPFFTTKAGGGGTGLGLATVQRIVNNLGGMVTVKSTLGQGSSFSVFLPITEQQPAAGPPPKAVVSQRAVGRILLVDDEPDFAGVLSEGLEQFGHKVTPFLNPRQAWLRFQEDPDQFDLLITDQHMGQLSGTDLAERVHSLRPDLPIVLCSGSYHTLDLNRERSIGVVRILRKPFSIIDLTELLDQLLAGAEDIPQQAAEN